VSSNNVVVELQLVGGRAFAAQAHLAGEAVGSIGDEATKAQKKSGGFMSKMGPGLAIVGRAAMSGAAAVGAAGAAAVGMGLKFNASLESAQTRFKLFTGSAEEAAKVVEMVNQVASNSTFARTDLSDVAARLGTAGVTGDRLTKTLQGVANAAAAAGGGAANLGQVTTALAQMSSTGVAQKGELAQIANAGIPAFQILQKELDLTSGQLNRKLTNGAITAKSAVDALTEGFTSGKMAQAAKDQANTVSGQMSNLVGRTQRTLGTLTAPLYRQLAKNVLPKVTEISKGIADWAEGGGMQRATRALSAGFKGLGKTSTGGFKGIDKVLVGIGAAVRPLWDQIKPLGKMFVEAFAPAMPFITNVLVPLFKGVLMGAFMGIVDTIKLLLWVIKPVAQVLGWIGEKAAPLAPILTKIGFIVGYIGVGFTKFLKPLAWAARGLGKLAGAAGKVISWLFRVSTTANKVGYAVLNLATKLAGMVPKFVAAGLKLAGGVVKAFFSIGKKIGNWIGKIPGALSTVAASVGRSMLGIGKTFVEKIVEGIKSSPGAILDAVKSLLPGGKLGGKLMDVLGLPGGQMGLTATGRMGGVRIVGEQGPEILRLPTGARVSPLAPSTVAGANLSGQYGEGAGGASATTAHFYLDRKLLATAVARHTSDQMARR
jgi:tape measure domain-containing protein